jgi:hypothetical protein
MTRRIPAAPGLRPRGRFAAGCCPSCGEWFVLDRAVQPWARARTCSTACAKRWAHRHRAPSTCRHCDMVEGYRLARNAQVQAREVAAADEDARPVVFRDWLQGYAWGEECAA